MSRPRASTLAASVPALLLAACSVAPLKDSPSFPMFELDRYADVQSRPGQDPGVTVVVAISGGGFRAANLGVGALLAMEDVVITMPDGSTSNLLREVDYFTTVSGGGFAAGTYMRALLAHEGSNEAFEFEEFLNQPEGEEALRAIRKSLIPRMMGYWISPKNWGPPDRGDLLQDHLDYTVLEPDGCDASQPETCSPGKSLQLGDVFARRGDPAPGTPYWIANATNFLNGSVFSFTPDNLCRQRVASYRHHGKVEPVDCSQGLAMSVPLSLGMRSSANFPVAIPTTSLPVSECEEAGPSRPCTIKLSDGGQADNLAFYSALEILSQDVQLRGERLDPGATPPRRLLVVIDAFRGSTANVELGEGSPGILRVVARSPSLPLDALRGRVRDSTVAESATMRSEVDSVLRDRNLAVAYINIDDEQAARSVGTNLQLSDEEQRVLLVAGYRQAYATLMKTCAWQSQLNVLGGLSVECERNDRAPGMRAAERGVIEFNQGIASLRRSQLMKGRLQAINRLSQESMDMKTSIDAAIALETSRRELEEYKNAFGEAVDQASNKVRTRALGHVGRALWFLTREAGRWLPPYSGDPGLVLTCAINRALRSAYTVVKQPFAMPSDCGDAVAPGELNVELVRLQENITVALQSCYSKFSYHDKEAECHELRQAADWVEKAIVALASTKDFKALPETVDTPPPPEAPAVCDLGQSLLETSRFLGRAAGDVRDAGEGPYPFADCITAGCDSPLAARIEDIAAKLDSPDCESASKLGLDVAKLIEPHRERMQQALTDLGCATRSFANAWPTANERFRTCASAIFTATDPLKVCNVPLQRLPSSESSCTAGAGNTALGAVEHIGPPESGRRQ